MFLSRLKQFEEDLSKALDQSGRSTKSIKVLLASKTIDSKALEHISQYGYLYFGENRAQELTKKQAELQSLGFTWDFIGHLQTNKVKDVVGKVNLIHSVDRLSLAEAINKQAANLGLKQSILIEVNTSNEETKSGVRTADFQTLVNEILPLKHIEIKGLMTIAENTKEQSRVRKCFQKLFRLRQELSMALSCSPTDLELSMGMSADYALAIEEGATIIRVGSAVFGPRLY